MVRLARANHIKVQTLCALIAGNSAPIWNRDIDRMAPPWLIDGLARLTGRPRAEIVEGTLSDLAEKIDIDHHPNGHATWILPLGIWHRKRTGFGVQFCPLCFRMDKEPYIRRSWRLAFYTECEHHRTLLLDRCPRCRQPHTYFRGEMGERDRIQGASMGICNHCGYDLAYAPVERFSEWPEWRTTVEVRNLQFMHDFGWVVLGDRKFEHSSELLLVLRHLVALMSSPTEDGQMYDAAAEAIWPQSHEALKDRETMYEARGVAERHRLFGMAVWLMQDWPTRLETCARTANITRSSLHERSEGLPSWFISHVRCFALPRSGTMRSVAKAVDGRAHESITAHGERTFKKHLAQVRAYKLRHGHGNVPVAPSGPGAWLAQERQLMKSRSYPNWKRDALVAEGVRISVKPKSSFAARLMQLKDFISAHGHSRVPADFDGGGLATWLYRQRQFAKATDYPLSSREALEVLGVSLAARTIGDRLSELRLFHAAHGHANPPARYAGGLGLWLGAQRRLAEAGRISLETLSVLRKLGVRLEIDAHNRANHKSPVTNAPDAKAV